MMQSYETPDIEVIKIAPMKSILQDISNPSGNTDPLDPEEG